MIKGRGSDVGNRSRDKNSHTSNKATLNNSNNLNGTKGYNETGH